MEIHDLAAGLFVFVGMVGTLVVVLPGLLLQVVAVGLWALEESSFIGWLVFAVVVVLAGSATLLKYLFPGRKLRQVGVPGWVLVAAAVAAGVGFFVVPVVGAPAGFVGAVYLFERARVGKTLAWPSTKAALRAVLASAGIELGGGVAILAVFAVGALLT